MELAFLVYVVETLLPGLGGLLFTVTFVGGLITLFMTFCYYILMDERDIEKARWGKNTLKTLGLKIVLPCALLYAVLPTKQTTYVMVGAYFTQELLTSGAVTDVLDKGNETVQLFIKRTNLQLKDDIQKLSNNEPTEQTTEE